MIRRCQRTYGMSLLCPNGLSRRSFSRLSKRLDRNKMRRMLRVSGLLSSLSPGQMQREKPTHELDKVDWQRRPLIISGSSLKHIRATKDPEQLTSDYEPIRSVSEPQASGNRTHPQRWFPPHLYGEASSRLRCQSEWITSRLASKSQGDLGAGFSLEWCYTKPILSHLVFQANLKHIGTLVVTCIQYPRPRLYYTVWQTCNSMIG